MLLTRKSDVARTTGPRLKRLAGNRMSTMDRRTFLKRSGLAAGAGAAAAATNALARPVVPAEAAAGADAAQGYRETEHVRDYYATTRI